MHPTDDGESIEFVTFRVLGFEGNPGMDEVADEVWELHVGLGVRVDRQALLARVRAHNAGNPIVLRDQLNEYSWGASSTSWLLEICTLVGGVAGFTQLLRMALGRAAIGDEDEGLRALSGAAESRGSLREWVAGTLGVAPEHVIVESADAAEGTLRMVVRYGAHVFDVEAHETGLKTLRRRRERSG